MDRRLIGALKALTDIRRLRVLAILATGDATVDGVAQAVDATPATVAHHLERLREAGIVETAGRWPHARYHLDPRRLDEIGRQLDEIERSTEEPVADVVVPPGRGLTDDEARILGNFFADGRLTTIPAQGSKRLVVLRYLRDRCFPEDRDYPEKEVNQLLAVVHPDAASLRRYLVDAGLMTRDAGVYRRAG